MPLLTGDLPSSVRSVHVMGIGGTAMAALAGMLKDAGYTVTGSDTGVYPPMSDYLASLGIEVMIGYEARNLAHRPDLVVVGNVIRAEYPEAQALLASDLTWCSFPQLLGGRFLVDRHPIVVAGTHGKTTTTALTAYLLDAAGQDPGFLIGGRATNFDRTARTGTGRPFVVEGDEYDTAFFDKGPKFLHYRPKTAILTSVEFDHADIYADLDHVKSSFRRLVDILPADGCLVARWDHDDVRDVCLHASCEVRAYGHGQAWDGRIDDVDTQRGTMRFTVLHHGNPWGRFESLLVGEHNLYNQVAAVAALAREGLTPEQLAAGFAGFRGIKRRQEIIGEPRAITVIDDFAHHPTAVRVTLEALRMRFGGRRLWAIFEPRSATSRRAVFQEAYAEAFDAADVVVVAAPHDQSRIASEERFDSQRLVGRIRARGREAFTFDTPAEIVDVVSANALPHDVVAILSNGGFGGLHGNLVRALSAPAQPA
jgi:UDP-N-acetylmuramate: L-alanyl-gamma-D-glutamyl-meso-diaminopimelate ligase